MGSHCDYSPRAKKKPSYAAGRRLVVILKPRPPYPPGRSSSTLGIGGWVGPTAGLYGFEEENNFLLLLGFEPSIDPARNPLPRLPTTMTMMMIIITIICQVK